MFSLGGSDGHRNTTNRFKGDKNNLLPGGYTQAPSRWCAAWLNHFSREAPGSQYFFEREDPRDTTGHDVLNALYAWPAWSFEQEAILTGCGCGIGLWPHSVADGRKRY